MIGFQDNEEKDLGAAFLGFIAGSVLFGITILQAFQYFRLNYMSDWARCRRYFVIYICLLDALHFSLSTFMMYCLLVVPNIDAISDPRVIWSFKAVGTIQTVVVISVQCFYLHQIWIVSQIQTLNRNIAHFVQVSVLTVLTYALVIGAVFLTDLEKVTSIISFSANFKNIIYLGLGSTASIDCGIAAIMSVVLHITSKTAGRRSIDVVRSLVLYFVGTGLLTAIAAIIAMSLYISRPTTLLYFAVEFSIIRLYVNAILALFKFKSRLQDRMNETMELRMPSVILFGDGIEGSREMVIGV